MSFLPSFRANVLFCHKQNSTFAIYAEKVLVMGLPVVSLADLDGLTESHDSYRACCPVHKGSNPTALVINKTGGRYSAGVGYCFVCGCNVVLVRELYSPTTHDKQSRLA